MRWLALVTGLAALSAGAMMTGSAYADGTVAATFEVDISSQYNYVTSSYEPVDVPSSFIFTAVIPDEVQATDYGDVEISQFGSLGQTAISNPLLSAIPVGEGNNGSTQGNINAYTILTADDYSSNFLNEFAIIAAPEKCTAQGCSYTDVQLRIDEYLPSRGGTGAAVQAYSASDLAAFLTGAEADPDRYVTNFFEDYGDFTDIAAGGVNYQDGKDYSGTVRVLSVSAAPEPATWALMIAGLGTIGLVLRRTSNTVPVRSRNACGGRPPFG